MTGADQLHCIVVHIVNGPFHIVSELLWMERFGLEGIHLDFCMVRGMYS